MAKNYAEIYKGTSQIDRTVATPVCSEVMSVARMYLRLEDLDVSRLKQPEIVKTLYVFADVIEMKESVTVPGLEAFIVCRVFDTFSEKIRDGYWINNPNWRNNRDLPDFLPPEWIPPLYRTVYPILTDGTTLHPLTTANAVPRSTLENSNMLLAMQATLVASEVILSFMTHATETVTEATLHVEFLNNLLAKGLEDTTSGSGGEGQHQLRTLLFRVQSLLKMQAPGLLVPRLQYNAYRNLISRMADMAAIYDTEFKQLNSYIQQNEVLGGYLLEQNKAFAAKEREMEEVHSELQEYKTSELRDVLATLDRLAGQMSEMSAEMDQAQEDMERGLVEYRNRQTARAVFSVLNAIAQIGLAFLTGGATAPLAVNAAANAAQSANKLLRVVETLERLLLVVELLVAVKDLFDAINTPGDMMAVSVKPEDMPSAAEWTIFENEIEAVAAEMPVEVTEVITWKAKCKNMAALGRELVTQAALVGQLQYEINLHSLQREVAKNQADRLLAIQPADLSNYQEMATQLDMRTTRILLGLLQVLSLQNGAIRYYYLQAPTPLSTTSATMTAVRTLLVRQEATAVISLAQLGTPSDREFTYRVKDIPTKLLLEGEDWDFAIPVSDRDVFPNEWNRVRISHLESKFVTAADSGEVHLPTTNTGEVYMLLRSENAFEDRKNGELLQYEATLPVQYQYAYNLETGETTEANRPSEAFANLFMQMTPFTRWKLRLSASASENRGLAFPTAVAADATTQIDIRFFVSAIRIIDWRT